MEKKIILSDLINMAEFVLKNNYFEFDSKVKKHISGSAIRTKLGPPYTFIFMDKVEREFPEAEDIKTMVMGEEIFLSGQKVKINLKDLDNV